ncbi:alpha-L-fucosidase [Sediminibacterium ginsengisoli]|uniref:alpha-L-fucosidase n=1 Tax=Sediminibacterium ginsengisoli TaxID=413434 RepID=A0A1T4QR13_9BACT|nr:alpha-L-fucosidase [Sediminibacterium ginsengisoli]SKA05698.1 alpha-L-fucosidase [Sediminibacterium ginsengisoli]
MRTCLSLLFCFLAASLPAQKIKPVLPLPSADQLKWHEKEFYLFMHFGPNTFTNKEWGDGKEKPSDFNPSDLDCRQWARIAKQSGAKGIIITAKHHDGFSLWPSRQSTHTVRESSWKNGKGDVLKELSEACRLEGIEMGVYISPWDRNHPAYGTPAYNDVYIATMKELLTQYGPFFELWWDGANGEGPDGRKQVYDFNRFEAAAFSLQPHLVIFSDIGPGARWVGNEKGLIGSTNWNLLDTAGFKRGHGAPPEDTLNRGNMYGRNWIPAEADVSIRPGWFYRSSEDSKVKQPAELFNIYLHSVGNGGNLLLNVPPDMRGHIHEADSAALMGLATLVKQAFKDDLLQGSRLKANTGNQARLKLLTDHNIDTWWASGKQQGTVIEIQLKEKKKINTLVLEEMISYGQRVISFSIDCRNGTAYQTVFEGSTIGRKKIAVFQGQETDRIRIRINDTKAEPVLRGIAAYNIPFRP